MDTGLTQTLKLRVSESDLAVWRDKAAEKRLTVSAWLRMLAVSECEGGNGEGGGLVDGGKKRCRGCGGDGQGVRVGTKCERCGGTGWES